MNKRFNKASARNVYPCKWYNNLMAWIMNLCVLYTSSYARDDNPRERFINSFARYNSPCARYNNPCARYNNPLSRNNNPFARYNISCTRDNKLSAQFNNSCKHALDIINRMHEIIIRFHDIIIWAHNWTIYVNWVVYSSDIITNEPNGHASLTWVYVFLYMYLLYLSHSFISHQKQFLPNVLEF